MTTAATSEETWVPIAEAASQLGVHPRTLRRYIRDGKLPVHRLSSQVVLIRPEDIEQFLIDNLKVTTGTGTCYVPRPEQRQVSHTRKHPVAAPPPKFSRE